MPFGKDRKEMQERDDKGIGRKGRLRGVTAALICALLVGQMNSSVYAEELPPTDMSAEEASGEENKTHTNVLEEGEGETKQPLEEGEEEIEQTPEGEEKKQETEQPSKTEEENKKLAEGGDGSSEDSDSDKDDVSEPEENEISEEESAMEAVSENTLEFVEAVPFLLAEPRQEMEEGTVFTSGQFTYNVIDKTNHYVEVSCTDITTISGKPIIPSTVEDDGGNQYTVTKVADKAFASYNGLCNITGITLPDTITEIGKEAFRDNRQLTDVVFSSNEKITKIGEGAFQKCGALTEIDLPDSIVSIEKSAFDDCRKLTRISWPKNLTTLGDLAFANCLSLNRVDMPDSVIGVGKHLFNACYSLKSENVKLSSNISAISDYMFRYCKFETYTIPNWIQSIGEGGFIFCKDLREVTLPVSVTEINDHAFQNCTSLSRLKIAVGVVAADGAKKVTPITVNYTRSPISGIIHVFYDCPQDRCVIFVAADGVTPLAGDDLAAAKEAYLAVDDGDVNDELWFGWKIAEENDDDSTGGENPPQGDDNSGTADKPDNDKPSGSHDDKNSSDGAGSDSERINGDAASGADLTETAVNMDAQAGASQPTLVATEAPAGKSVKEQTAADGETDSKDTQGREPKTGDTTYMEIYATLAMIAGLIYLLLYFMEEKRGMTEREKEVFVAAFIRWAQKGGVFRKCCAMAAIFCILLYYHVFCNYFKNNACNSQKLHIY